MWLRVVIFCAWSASISACSSSASFRERIFDDGSVRYRVGSQTEHFQRISVADNDLAWHDPRYGTISVNSTCQQYEDVPARALLNHLLMGTTDRKFNVEETVTLDGRAAQHVVADVQLDGVPVTVDVYLIVKDGCVYDLTLIVPREKLSAAQPLFEAFVRDFAVLATKVAHERD